jgi:trigger factor
LPDAIEKAVDEHDLDIVSRPEVSVEEAEAGEGVVVSAIVWTRPEAKIADYKGISYKAVGTEVSDEEIDAVIEDERNKNSRLILIEDARPLQNGDLAVIDYEGSVDGVVFEGGTAKEAELEIGSGRFIPGFEEQLIGMKAGDDKDITVTFPEEYHAEHLAGNDAVFKIHLHSIHIKEKPDLDDDFAESVSEFETLKEYRADIKEKIESGKKQSADTAKEEALAESLSNLAEVDVPEVMLDNEVNQMTENFARSLSQRGIDPAMYLQYMGKTVEELKDDYRKTAVHNVRARLALEAIAKAEGFTSTEDEVAAEIERIAGLYDMDADKLKESMSEKERKSLTKDLGVQKAMKLVLAEAVPAEEAPES